MLQDNISKILVVNLGGIGDVLLSTPALRALKDAYPKAKLDMLVVPRAKEVLKPLGYVDKIHYLYLGGGLYGLLVNAANLLMLRKSKFDLAINMRTLVSGFSAFKIGFLLKIIRPRIKAGRDTREMGGFFDLKIPESFFGDKFEMEYDIGLVEELGAKVVSRNIDFVINDSAYLDISRILQTEGVADSDKIIGLHLGGKPSHRWPWQNYPQLISALKEKTGAKFVITAENEDAGKINKIFGNTPGIINLTGRISFWELGALISRCFLYVTNDTANMHLAAILKTPLVAIFGPGFLKRYDPRCISSSSYVIYNAVDCAPCNKISCSSLKCLKNISAQDVVDAAMGLWRENSEHSVE
ncbi:MAG: glycosyltransferase family 9 protein [Candidatus Omnitrophota bacterium]